MKVKERFLFYRVDMPCYDLAVNKAKKNSVLVFPDRANASFTGRYCAALRAQEALYLSITDRLVKPGFFHRLFPII